MSAMKPDAWMDSNGVCYTNKVSAEYYGCSEPLYTLATVRKWLEEVTHEMLGAGTLHDMEDMNADIGADVGGIYRAMIAAKLRELEVGK